MLEKNIREIQKDKYKDIISVMNMMEINYTENYSVQHYADICNLNKYYFIKLFKEYTGYSPCFYRTKIRIEKAKELLANTNMNNTEIAEKTGYQSSYYFSRIFKANTGMSPKTFREITRKNS